MSKLTKLIGKVKFGAIKHAPAICLVAGTVAVVGGVIAAVKATSDSQEELDYISEELDAVDEQEEAKEISDEEAKKLRNSYRRRYAKTLAKNYWLPVGLVGGGLSLFYVSHHIQSNRIAGLSVALAGSKAAYDMLAENVKKEYGEDVLKKLKYGLHEEMVEVRETNPDGIEIAHMETLTDVSDMKSHSPYAMVFDETNNYWSDDPLQRAAMFENIQVILKHSFERNGFMFLNEAYKCLGGKQTAAGNVVGWVFGSNDKMRDNEIKLDIQEFKVPSIKHRGGYETRYIIDFNVDGPILNDFEKYQRF